MTASLQDDIFQINGNGNCILVGQSVGLKDETTFRPGEQSVYDLQEILANTADNVLLSDRPGIDEHHRQLFVTVTSRSVADHFGLIGRQLARASQHPYQMAVMIGRGRVDQLALSEKEGRGYRIFLKGKCTRLSGQVDQIQELGDAKVPEIPL
jgi:hypothetical protein